jgi:hypothetical protein
MSAAARPLATGAATRVFRALLFGLFCACAPSLWAQDPPPATEPGHTWRTLPTAEIAFPARWRPSLTGGGLAQVSLRPDRVTTEGDIEVILPPAWYFHAMATAGVSFDEDGDGDVGLAASLGLGIVRRVDPTPISSAGIVVEGRWGPRGIAPAVRVELHDNVGAQLGWIFVDGEDGDDGLFVSIDAMRGLFADLGLWPSLR